MVRIIIKFLAQLEEIRPEEQIREYPSGTTISAILDDLALQENSLGIMLLNGRYATSDSIVRDEDVLCFLPMVDGG